MKKRAAEKLKLVGRTVLLPVVVAITSSIAAVNHGPVRVYWTLGAIASTIGLAVLNILKEISTEKQRLNAVNEQEELRKSKSVASLELRSRLAEASQPLINSLGAISAAQADATLKEEARILLARVINTARTEVGAGVRESKRIDFYSLLDNQRLELVQTEGREGSAPPPPAFQTGHSDESRSMVELAKGDKVELISDLHTYNGRMVADPHTRPYRSALFVPANANGENFGLLCLTATEPETLNDIDKRYMLLLAGVLAAGLAQLRRKGIVIGRNGDFRQTGA